MQALGGIPFVEFHTREQSLSCAGFPHLSQCSPWLFLSLELQNFSDLSSWRDSVPLSPAWSRPHFSEPPRPHFPRLPVPPYWLWMGWDMQHCSASSALGS